MILGADGFIGSRLYMLFKSEGREVIGTSFLPDATGTLLHVDIRQPNKKLLMAVSEASHVICAISGGGIDDCAADSIATRCVNVEAIKNILRKANSQTVPVYLSSNMIFSGEKDGYTEDEVPHPSTEYGRQKLEVETWIQKKFPRHVIVRLTKVYGLGLDDATLFSGWHKALMAGEPIKAIEDMVVAPVFVGDVAQAILSLVQQDEVGIFHMAGPVSASFFELAVGATRAWKLPSGLVEKVQRADFVWQEKRPYWHTLAVTGKIATLQKSFLTPEQAWVCYLP